MKTETEKEDNLSKEEKLFNTYQELIRMLKGGYEIMEEEQEQPDINDIVGVNHPAELGQI